MKADAGRGSGTLLDRVADRICAVTGAQRSAVVFGEHDNQQIHFVSAAGEFAERLRGARGPAEGSGLCGNVLAGNCSILSRDSRGDPRIHQGHATEMGIRTALAVPVHHAGQPFAVLMALNREDGGPFSAADEAALEQYAREVADDLWPAAAHAAT